MVRSLCFTFVMPSTTSAYTLLDHEIRDCQCVESFPVQFSCQFCGNRACATVTVKRHLPSIMRQTPLRADILRVVNDIKSHCYVPRQPRNNLFPQAHHSHFVGVAVLTPSTWQTSWVPSIQEVKHSNLCGQAFTRTLVFVTGKAAQNLVIFWHLEGKQSALGRTPRPAHTPLSSDTAINQNFFTNHCHESFSNQHVGVFLPFRPTQFLSLMTQYFA